MRTRWQGLYAALDRFVRSLQAQQGFQQVRQYPILARFAQAVELVEYLASKGGDLDEKDRILGQLVHLVQGREQRELASALLWLGLWPGLDAVVRRRRRCFQGQSEELVAEMGDVFTSLVGRLDLKAVNRVAATLVRSTERDLMQRRRRAWADEARQVSAQAGGAARDHNEGVLAVNHLDRRAYDAWAACQGPSSVGRTPGLSWESDVVELRMWLAQIVGADADLLIEVLVLGENQREAAERLGLSHEVARKRCQRALIRLRDYFSASLSHEGLAPRVCSTTKRARGPKEPAA